MPLDFTFPSNHGFLSTVKTIISLQWKLFSGDTKIEGDISVGEEDDLKHSLDIYLTPQQLRKHKERLKKDGIEIRDNKTGGTLASIPRVVFDSDVDIGAKLTIRACLSGDSSMLDIGLEIPESVAQKALGPAENFSWGRAYSTAEGLAKGNVSNAPTPGVIASMIFPIERTKMICSADKGAKEASCLFLEKHGMTFSAKLPDGINPDEAIEGAIKEIVLVRDLGGRLEQHYSFLEGLEGISFEFPAGDLKKPCYNDDGTPNPAVTLIERFIALRPGVVLKKIEE